MANIFLLISPQETLQEQLISRVQVLISFHLQSQLHLQQRISKHVQLLQVERTCCDFVYFSAQILPIFIYTLLTTIFSDRFERSRCPRASSC